MLLHKGLTRESLTLIPVGRLSLSLLPLVCLVKTTNEQLFKFITQLFETTYFLRCFLNRSQTLAERHVVVLIFPLDLFCVFFFLFCKKDIK